MWYGEVGTFADVWMRDTGRCEEEDERRAGGSWWLERWGYTRHHAEPGS